MNGMQIEPFVTDAPITMQIPIKLGEELQMQIYEKIKRILAKKEAERQIEAHMNRIFTLSSEKSFLGFRTDEKNPDAPLLSWPQFLSGTCAEEFLNQKTPERADHDTWNIVIMSKADAWIKDAVFDVMHEVFSMDDMQGKLIAAMQTDYTFWDEESLNLYMENTGWAELLRILMRTDAISKIILEPASAYIAWTDAEYKARTIEITNPARKDGSDDRNDDD